MPSNRLNPEMVYDSIKNKIIMFGGYTGEYESDTLELKIEAIGVFSSSTSDNIDSSEIVLLSITMNNPSDTETSQKDESPILLLIPFTIILIVRLIWRKEVST